MSYEAYFSINVEYPYELKSHVAYFSVRMWTIPIS
jgi:hypothetical protein